MIYISQLLPTCKYLQTACTSIYSNFHGRDEVVIIELWSRNFENTLYSKALWVSTGSTIQNIKRIGYSEFQKQPPIAEGWVEQNEQYLQKVQNVQNV